MQIRLGGEIRTIIAIVLLLFLVNLSQLFTSWYFSWGVLVLFVAVLLMIAKKGGLTLNDLGLRKETTAKGLLWGTVAALSIVLVLLVVFFVDRKLFLDNRYHNVLSKALVGAFITVPLHTVLAEELAFRGVLWGSLKRDWGATYATIVSSILFGLWHVVPSLHINHSSSDASSLVGAGEAGQFISIFGIVIATTIAGVALCEIRRKSDSLVAPILAHWAINGTAIILAAMAWAF